MAEKNLIINNQKITYKGIFRVNELFKTINDALEKNGYTKKEKKTEETVFPAGKNTHIELRPFKSKSNYITLMIKIKIDLENIIETTKEVDGIPKNFQQGDVSVVIDAWSITDYANRWGMKPWFFFLKGMVHKYIYKFPLETGAVDELQVDTKYLIGQVRSLLNLYKYQLSHVSEPTELKELKEPTINKEVSEVDNSESPPEMS